MLRRKEVTGRDTYIMVEAHPFTVEALSRVGPAPSARRCAALGLTAQRDRANWSAVACSQRRIRPSSDNVRQVACWFSQLKPPMTAIAIGFQFQPRTGP
jgi:hypothetical protein